VSPGSGRGGNTKADFDVAAEGVWQGRVIPHRRRCTAWKNDPGRVAEGIYDKMGPLGAHEVVIGDAGARQEIPRN